MSKTDPQSYARSLLGYSWEQITTQLQGRKRQQALALWQWAAIRFSSYGTAQQAYFRRYGAEATFARINRVRAWLGLDPI
jgi:hypothetical protein